MGDNWTKIWFKPLSCLNVLGELSRFMQSDALEFSSILSRFYPQQVSSGNEIGTII